jgi:predicted anti-sigma-YlaC factor YlaD
MSDCSTVQRQLSDFADGLLESDAHAAVLTHVRECADCSGVLADLERLLATARRLGPITPPDHVWLSVAGQLRAQSSAPAAPTLAPRARGPVWWQWAALSAALLAITVALYVLGRQRTASTDAVADANAVAAPPTGSIQAVNDELLLAMRHYERAVAELEAAARAGDGTLDPSVATTMRASLTSIDQAIAESRAALLTNPDSEPARDSLFEALRRKISVLQATVSLINDMRQGDPAGASRSADRLGRQS